eukprot:SAG31_NODE_381_length_16458_cov_18.069259_8_plen_154_part_00
MRNIYGRKFKFSIARGPAAASASAGGDPAPAAAACGHAYGCVHVHVLECTSVLNSRGILKYKFKYAPYIPAPAARPGLHPLLNLGGSQNLSPHTARQQPACRHHPAREHGVSPSAGACYRVSACIGPSCPESPAQPLGQGSADSWIVRSQIQL